MAPINFKEHEEFNYDVFWGTMSDRTVEGEVWPEDGDEGLTVLTSGLISVLARMIGDGDVIRDGDWMRTQDDYYRSVSLSINEQRAVRVIEDVLAHMKDDD